MAAAGSVVPATVTCSSAIASSSADCVFGVARLISSASSTWLNSGPSTKTSSRRPSSRSRMIACSGDVGWHQVDRELDPVEAQVERLAERTNDQRLASTRHSLDQHVAAGEERHQDLLEDLACPTITRETCSRILRTSRGTPRISLSPLSMLHSSDRAIRDSVTRVKILCTIFSYSTGTCARRTASSSR